MSNFVLTVVVSQLAFGRIQIQTGLTNTAFHGVIEQAMNAGSACARKARRVGQGEQN